MSEQQLLSLQPFNRYLLTEDTHVYFLHIPKSAGTTLKHILESHFTQEEIYAPYWWNDEFPPSSQALETARLIRGHFCWWIHNFVPYSPLVLTFLRNPVERTISHYEHFIRDQGISIYEDVKSMSLVEFIQNPSTRAILQDHQTYAIGSDVNVRAVAREFSPMTDLKNFYYRIYEVQSRCLGELALQKAKQRLQQIAFVGITERFDSSVQLLNYTFHWQPVQFYETLNVSPSKLDRNKIPANVLNEILDITRLDQELYEYGVRLFEERYRKMLFELLTHDYKLSQK